ncbi:hypothetical protein BPT24_059 [Tenacibaculum phage pT24]|uniref:Uncharacterized protein n=1 Tax=Tenacibaculum phage pT24 TaxID=1880590 RepID=A0A1B4XWK0_9CAUD|nr:hypothetical protein HYP10_gp059 [Tenacibaculum phage pT24]BAV39182.1 hypothetical protein BPT24_059 [Tenacibaculum phage pT24]
MIEVTCITDDLEHYDKGETYSVYRWEKDDDCIWIKDNLGGSDCWGKEKFDEYFKGL